MRPLAATGTAIPTFQYIQLGRTMRARMRHRGAVTVATLVATAAVAAGIASSASAATHVDRLNCNTSVLSLLGLDLSELIGDPCDAAETGIALPLDGDAHIYVLRGFTGIVPGLTGPQGANSAATLLDLRLLSHIVPIRVLDSSAYVTCRARLPELTAGSQLIGGIDVPLLSNFEIDEPLNVGDVIFVNETVSSATQITQRALRIATPAGDVILSEATAGFTKNPCKRVRKTRR